MQVWLKLHTNRWLSNRWWSRNLQSTSLKLKKRKKKSPIINDNSFSVQHLRCPRSLCFSLRRAHLKQSPFNCSLQRSGSEWTLTPGCLPSSIVSRLIPCTWYSPVEPRLCTCISGSSVSPAIATKFVDISFESDSVKVVRMDPLELRAASSEFAYTDNWPSLCYVLELDGWDQSTHIFRSQNQCRKYKMDWAQRWTVILVSCQIWTWQYLGLLGRLQPQPQHWVYLWVPSLPGDAY